MIYEIGCGIRAALPLFFLRWGAVSGPATAAKSLIHVGASLGAFPDHTCHNPTLIRHF